MLAYLPVELSHLESLANTFIIPAGQNLFDNAPVRLVPVAINTNSAFTRAYTENPFWYQQFDIRQTNLLRGGQPCVDFDAVDNFRFFCWDEESLELSR